MLTIKYDLYDRLLKTVNIKYILNNANYQYEEVSTIPKKFDMIVPPEIQNELGMSNSSPLTYIASGRRSLYHDVTDANRAHLKETMRRVRSKHFKVMEKHIKKLVTINAAIISYKKEINYIKREFRDYEINNYIDNNVNKIEMECRNIESNISKKLAEISDEFLSDKRITSEMCDYLRNNIRIKPLQILEILFFLSLFEENDMDPDFYKDFEAHYISNYDKISDVTSEEMERMMVLNELLKIKNRIKHMSNICNDDAFEIVYKDNQLCALVRLK